VVLGWLHAINQEASREWTEADSMS